jgi:hypothetical protein
MERNFRRLLSDPQLRAPVKEALDWDDSQVSRFMSGQQGIPIDKIDAAIEAMGMVVTSRQYLDFLAFGSQIGTACHCARVGMGECGPDAR